MTSCRCLKVIWSVLKASGCPLGSLTKASWSVQKGSKQYATETQVGDLKLVFRSTLQRFESLLKPRWTPEEGFLGAPERNIRGPTGVQKSISSFRGLQQTLFRDLPIVNVFKAYTVRNHYFLCFLGRGFLDPPPGFLDTLSKINI